MKLIDEAGRERTTLQALSASSGSGSIVGGWLWQIDGPGRYELLISYEGIGTFTRQILVQ